MGFLSSLTCPCELIKPKKGMVETFDTAIWSDVQVKIWTSDGHLKTDGDGGQSVGLSP